MNALTVRLTHVRDGDAIVVDNTPIRFSNFDSAELGTAAGERAKVGIQVLAGHGSIGPKTNHVLRSKLNCMIEAG